jgi:1,4-dihydroxy-6-naphthoate synthase
MNRKLQLAFSPCPNDTFMFAALANGWLDTEGTSFEIVLEDIEQLNQRAVRKEADVIKMSFPAFAQCAGNYTLLESGTALGNGCGPLLITKNHYSESDVSRLSIAIPGRMTTANLLLSIFFPEAENKTEMIFSEIEEAVLSGRHDAGVIIHENRFTYRQKGLLLLADLGKKWEETMCCPLPLGCIAVKRNLTVELKNQICRLVRKSIEYAFANRERVMPYVKQHAQEMDEQVMQQHIELYVNRYSIALGTEGKQAIMKLLKKGYEAGLLPEIKHTVFLQL